MSVLAPLLIVTSVVSATIVLCACFGASSEFRNKMRKARRKDEDHNRAQWMWKRILRRIK
jgi:hypothetical protein